MQVQWNACYAAGSLFLTSAAASLAAKLGVLHQLLRTMLQLIQTSPSYKVSYKTYQDLHQPGLLDDYVMVWTVHFYSRHLQVTCQTHC